MSEPVDPRGDHKASEGQVGVGTPGHRHSLANRQDFAESRSGGDRGDNQIGDFVGDGGQNPSLEESVKLEPFIVVFRERDDGAVEVALEIESAYQEEKEATPLLVVWLRETEKNRDMEFDVGDRRESKMRSLGRGGVCVGGDLAVSHWREESRRRERRGGERLLPATRGRGGGAAGNAEREKEGRE
ncbi:unnamed protein product, partial [Cuscuta campestris]